MKTYAIREIPEVRLSGRFDREQEGFPMMWTGACATMRVRGSALEARIACDYTVYNPYLSFEVDGLRAQFFAPLKGAHWYSVFLGMDANTEHEVRITLETQAFSADPLSQATLLSLRTDGVFGELPAPKLKLEFVGDSVTSGEGMRGPTSFMEWVPMMFSASSNYARYAAELLHADYQVVSQSGWGIVSSWDNNPAFNLPAVYDYVCRPVALDGQPNRGGEKPYDFAFKPDWVIIGLGANDQSASGHEPWIDPKTGEAFKQDLSAESRKRFEDAYVAFLHQVQRANPQARILCMYDEQPDSAYHDLVVHAVARAAKDGVPARYVQLDDPSRLRNALGSREHPGEGIHRMMARVLAREIRHA